MLLYRKAYISLVACMPFALSMASDWPKSHLQSEAFERAKALNHS